jgi:predicted nucleic acid-binding protein
MSAEFFLDTNVLVYAFGAKAQAGAEIRTEIAQGIVERGGAISVQVLNEFARIASRKAILSWDQITGFLEVIKELCDPPVPISLEIHESAVRLSRRYGFGINDSLIIAAALRAGCKTIYSEDMQHGQIVDGVRIENPFLQSPAV